MPASNDRQVTSAAIRFGKHFAMEARTDFSPAGLVAVGLMVSGILLSSAVIVAAAGRHKRRPRQVETGSNKLAGSGPAE